MARTEVRQFCNDLFFVNLVDHCVVSIISDGGRSLHGENTYSVEIIFDNQFTFEKVRTDIFGNRGYMEQQGWTFRFKFE